MSAPQHGTIARTIRDGEAWHTNEARVLPLQNSSTRGFDATSRVVNQIRECTNANPRR